MNSRNCSINCLGRKLPQRIARLIEGHRGVGPIHLDDPELLRKASNARNGHNFDPLWRGDWKGLYKSQSEADMALCCTLAFWTGKNAEQMDRLFRRSALYREKWDRQTGDMTYGERTIKNAIAKTTCVYKGR